MALVEVLDRIEKEPYHWPVGRVGFQKIAYFATELGIPTGLEYRRGSFGPYASTLKGVHAKLINNGLIREEQLGRMLRVRVGPTFQDAREAYRDQLMRWEPIIDRLVDLFLRLPTGEAEIVATVHFVASSLARSLGRVPTEREVLEEVMAWKQRRRPPPSEADVARTIRALNVVGWTEMEASSDLPSRSWTWSASDLPAPTAAGRRRTDYQVPPSAARSSGPLGPEIQQLVDSALGAKDAVDAG